MPPPFENRYKKTHVKTDKDCWTCRKTTRTCLLTDNYASGGDFLYTCEGHLKDPNFATPLKPEVQEKTASTGVSQSEIDAAVKEYQERKKAKADKEGAVDEKEASGNDTKIAVSEKKDLDKKSKPSSSQPTSPAPPEPTHYQLHKSFFDMRVRLHQQKTHLKDAQSRRSQLVFPAAPSAQPGIGQSSLAAK